MLERRQIVELARGHRRAGDVLVTLVATEGSSYRKSGARLFISRGTVTGTISGGCLEAEVVKRAQWAVRAGAVVERYSTAFDEAGDAPYGLGCGGVVDLLLEPCGTSECDALLEAMERSLGGERFVVVTWKPEPGGAMRRAVLTDKNDVIFQSKGVDAERIGKALCGDEPNVFVERLDPPQRLIVLGAGHDARPLVSMGALLGWNIVVVDGRSHLARQERFPEAQQTFVMDAMDAYDLKISRDDAVVVMTHSYEQDRDWLAAMLPLAPRYLGILGAKHRSGMLVADVSEMIGLSVEECCGRMYAPVGLDLGGDGPEAIALAVIAEVQACCMGRPAASRRLSVNDVVARSHQENAPKLAAASCALEFNAL